MMGVRDYVLGLECGNCYPDGRDVMRRTGMLKFLKPGEKKRYRVDVALKQGRSSMSSAIRGYTVSYQRAYEDGNHERQSVKAGCLFVFRSFCGGSVPVLYRFACRR